MSWFSKNVLENPFLNPILAPKAIGEKIRKNNGGTANERVENYNVPILPGCNETLNRDCSFIGTDADWQDLRTNWINGCTAANNDGILTSKNKTLAACQAAFDSRAADAQLGQYAKNADALTDMQNFVKGQASPIVYLIIFLFVGLIVYLLMSKK